ncbi:hypothetical protein [Methanobrevibacter sp.]|uniref:hypothetical protein n=1 Tax=Methanobrevibacter sp. TaxID=66852 RepID=UPI0038698DC0
MDKRWILILIILIVGCACLYHIVDSSTTVGDAITVVNKSVITLPSDFSIDSDDKSSVTLINKDTNETIFIKDLGKSDTAFDCFKKDLKSLDGVVNNSTLNIDNITTYRIDMQNSTTKSNTTLVYVYSSNHTFTIKFNDYTDQNELNQDLNFIVSTLSPDFKQKQD